MHPSDILKLIFIYWLESIGDQDSAKKIVEKGLPNKIYIYGQDYDFKIPFARCILCKRMIVEQGKVILDYSPIPNLRTGGYVSSGIESIVPEKGCEFGLRGKLPEIKECKDKPFTFNAESIPDTEWSEMLKRWNTKVDHQEDMGK